MFRIIHSHTSPRQDFLAMHRWLCRQRTKVARKCKCQRKLLIVSAVAFALPFLAARPRTKSQRRKKNIKPYGGEKKKMRGRRVMESRMEKPSLSAHCCLRLFGYFFWPTKQQARACRSGFLNFCRARSWSVSGSGSASIVNRALLTGSGGGDGGGIGSGNEGRTLYEVIKNLIIIVVAA